MYIMAFSMKMHYVVTFPLAACSDGRSVTYGFRVFPSLRFLTLKTG